MGGPCTPYVKTESLQALGAVFPGNQAKVFIGGLNSSHTGDRGKGWDAAVRSTTPSRGPVSLRPVPGQQRFGYADGGPGGSRARKKLCTPRADGAFLASTSQVDPPSACVRYGDMRGDAVHKPRTAVCKQSVRPPRNEKAQH